MTPLTPEERAEMDGGYLRLEDGNGPYVIVTAEHWDSLMASHEWYEKETERLRDRVKELEAEVAGMAEMIRKMDVPAIIDRAELAEDALRRQRLHNRMGLP